MRRLYERDIFDEKKLADIDWTTFSYVSAPLALPEDADPTWEALDVLVQARGIELIADVRTQLKQLESAWLDAFGNLFRTGRLSLWWPVAEQILQMRRVYLERLIALRPSALVEASMSLQEQWKDDPHDSFRPVAIVPTIVALRLHPDFAHYDVLDVDLKNERRRAGAEIERIESELEALVEAIGVDSIYRTGRSATGFLPRLRALFERKHVASSRLSRLEKAAGGPEQAVGEMVAAIIIDAGGYESVADFLEASDEHPVRKNRKVIERQVERTSGEIRSIDMELERLSRPGSDGAQKAPAERLAAVLELALARMMKDREFHDLCGELESCQTRSDKRDPVDELLTRALAGEEAGRAELEQWAGTGYPRSPEFFRAIGLAKWDSIAESVSRQVVAVRQEQDSPAIEPDTRSEELPLSEDAGPFGLLRDVEEFRLPASLERIPAPDDLTPWISRMLGRTSEEVLGILKEDWSEIRHPTLERVREILLMYQPVALCRREGRWYLGMHRSFNDSYEDTVYIESPPEIDSIRKALEPYEFEGLDLLLAFNRHFYGLTTDAGYPSSRFSRPGEFTTIAEYGWDEIIAEYDPAREWADAPIIYQTDTGDQVIMQPSGRTAWGLMAENRITPFAPSFEVVLEQMIETYEYYFILDYYRWVEKWRPHR
jgi:hypothetical protein